MIPKPEAVVPSESRADVGITTRDFLDGDAFFAPLVTTKDDEGRLHRAHADPYVAPKSCVQPRVEIVDTGMRSDEPGAVPPPPYAPWSGFARTPPPPPRLIPAYLAEENRVKALAKGGTVVDLQDFQGVPPLHFAPEGSSNYFQDVRPRGSVASEFQSQGSNMETRGVRPLGALRQSCQLGIYLGR